MQAQNDAHCYGVFGTPVAVGARASRCEEGGNKLGVARNTSVPIRAILRGSTLYELRLSGRQKRGMR